MKDRKKLIQWIGLILLLAMIIVSCKAGDCNCPQL